MATHEYDKIVTLPVIETFKDGLDSEYVGKSSLVYSTTSTSMTDVPVACAINDLAMNMMTGMSAYSPASTYELGDRVRYGTFAYECIYAIEEPEAWTSGHWTALPSLQDQIDDITTGAGLDEITPAEVRNIWDTTDDEWVPPVELD